MKMTATIQSGEMPFTVEVDRLVRTMGIGVPTTVQLRVSDLIRGDGWQNELSAVLAQASLGVGEILVSVTMEGSTQPTLVAKARILGATRERARSTGPAPRVLRAQVTSWPEEALVPRSRVHRGTHAMDLLKNYAGVAEPSPAVKSLLSVPLRDDGVSVAVPQRGLSDAEFLGRLLVALSEALGCSPLRLSGFLGSPDDPRWSIQIGDINGTDKLTPAPAGPTLGTDDTPPEPEWELLAVDDGPIPATWTNGPTPVAIRSVSGLWDPLAWHGSGAQPLPWDGDGGWVHRVVDEIDTSNGVARWTQHRWHASKFAPAPGTPAEPGLPSGAGWGTVVQVDRNEPTVTVELDRFEDDASQLDVHLVTASSGSGGTAGLHLTPEVGTTVLVTWTGQVDQPPVLLGNTRLDPVNLEAPSLDLGRKARVRLADVRVEEVGAVEVASDLDTHLQRDVHHRVSGETRIELAKDARIEGTRLVSRYKGDVVLESEGAIRKQAGKDLHLAGCGSASLTANREVSVVGAGHRVHLRDEKVEIA